MESFYLLIDALAQADPGQREAGERRIRDAFEVERAVLVLDMSGFSLSVRRSGIIAHLCQIRRVQRLALPIVEDHGGELVKCEADNILAVFANPAMAVDAALAINRAISSPPEHPAGGMPVTVGIGVDFGKLLLIPGKDAFGDAVNIAHKLGEDVARASEILVTEEAWRRIGPQEYRHAEMPELSLSGLKLRAFRIIRPGA